MSKSLKELELHVVIQFGGTENEQYLHLFRSEAPAKRFIRSADRSAYRCLGPFQLGLPAVQQLNNAAKTTVDWLEASGFRGAPLVKSLASAITDYEAEWALS